MEQHPADRTIEFIGNCIDEMLKATCVPSMHVERSRHLARIVELAATSGLTVAHREAVRLMREAKKGKYSAR